ncbi:hypothetical protein DH2020_042904 [Rehmannia glutinosa]|uniref:NB-ARC domain-containing protein n=1 Tax=Rehmannia glutinosa TaxID=99300 RepID=A0ABR0UL47_REHGL
MDQIENHPLYSFCLDKKQIEALGDKVGFLLDFVEGNYYHYHGGVKEAEVLERQITSAAYAAEDLIESHVVDQIHDRSINSLLDLHQVIQDMETIKEKVMEFKEKTEFNKDEQLKYSLPATTNYSSTPFSNEKKNMVGFDDELIQLMDILSGQQLSHRQIIPITGMGGIGKTTLAQNVYENSVIVQYFDIRAWATVAQKNTREILLDLLSFQLGKQENNEMGQKSEDQLGQQLYKSLYGRRYLIILDDMWSIMDWDNIKMFIPINDNGSRIVVTTRESNVALHFGSSYFTMRFLDEDKSWNLFCEKAFAQQGCPPELEKIGMEIVKKCKGLPLSLVVIGGLLKKSPRTQEFWETTAKDIKSILNSKADDQCLNLLSLSYSHLPVHLKPCFLYMGVFPEDHDIRVSRLIKLWVAEGFIKPNKAQSLDEIAKGYLKDLIDRNLILARTLRSNGKLKTCTIHDLLRDLSLKLAEKENFLSVTRVFDHTPRPIDGARRIVFHESIPLEYHTQVFHGLQSSSLARSLIYKEGPLPLRYFKLLRVLNLIDISNDIPEAIFQQINLRYLAYELFPISKLPSSIFLLWNIQTLIIKNVYYRVYAPAEIWEMSQLRHLEIDGFYLPDPSCDMVIDKHNDFVLRNLETLLKVVDFRLTEEVCKRIPNVKKLSVLYDDLSWKETKLCNLGRLHKLVSLECSVFRHPNQGDLLRNIILPSSLQKLILRKCCLHWEDLSVIGSLPHLEVLKLDWDSVTGSEWNPVEGQFLRLEFLKIHNCDGLTYWNADRSHFPVLRNLVLEELPKLKEIPLGIGEIPTLQVISLTNCSESAAISTIKLTEEQENVGNYGLQVRVKFLTKEELLSFRENVELMSFIGSHFQLEVSRLGRI